MHIPLSMQCGSDCLHVPFSCAFPAPMCKRDYSPLSWRTSIRIVGIKAVLVLAPQKQVSQRFVQQRKTSRFVMAIRVTDVHTFEVFKELAARLHFEVKWKMCRQYAQQ